MHPMPAGRGLRTGTPHWCYLSHRMRSGPILVKPRRRFKWNEMANCGDTYVFFDPLSSWVSMLSSNNQSLAPHNGCQEGASKRGLDRFIRPTQSSITLTVNTLGAGNKNQQLSRGSEPLNTRRHITGNTLMITSNFCQQESRTCLLQSIGPSFAWHFKTVRGNISFLRPPRNCFEISLLLHITGQCLQNETKPYQRNVFVNKSTS